MLLLYQMAIVETEWEAQAEVDAEAEIEAEADAEENSGLLVEASGYIATCEEACDQY